MTDLEMLKLCAEAMGYKIVYPDQADLPLCIESSKGAGVYFPLHDDAQAMALVKKLELGVLRNGERWEVIHGLIWGRNTDLNRAIVECVAQMQKAKDKP